MCAGGIAADSFRAVATAKQLGQVHQQHLQRRYATDEHYEHGEEEEEEREGELSEGERRDLQLEVRRGHADGRSAPPRRVSRPRRFAGQVAHALLRHPR